LLAIRFGLLGPGSQLGDVQAASAQEGAEEQEEQPDDEEWPRTDRAVQVRVERVAQLEQCPEAGIDPQGSDCS